MSTEFDVVQGIYSLVFCWDIYVTESRVLIAHLIRDVLPNFSAYNTQWLISNNHKMLDVRPVCCSDEGLEDVKINEDVESSANRWTYFIVMPWKRDVQVTVNSIGGE